MPRIVASIAASLGFLATAAIAQTPPPTPPTLDPAGVRGVHELTRDDAVNYAKSAAVNALFDWQQVGVVKPRHVVTAAEMRLAFDGNALQAERRFAGPFIVSGTLQAASRRADRRIVVGFREGGVADGMRRAMPVPGVPEFGDMTGGLITGGAQAILPAEYADTVSEWNPGSTIALLCTAASNVRLAVLLDGCIPQEAAIARAERAADVQAELALARQPLTVPSQRDDDREKASLLLLVSGYAVGLASKPCRETEATARIQCGMRRAQRDKRLADTLVQQTMRDLGLPVPQASSGQPQTRPRPVTPPRP